MAMNGTRRIRHRPRGSLVSVVDVGTTKIVCFIARVEDGDELRIVGVGHQHSLGLKAGTIVDMASATNAIMLCLGHLVQCYSLYTLAWTAFNKNSFMLFRNAYLS